jgi:histidine ammonia-lyase
MGQCGNNSGPSSERLKCARAISRAISIVDVGVGPYFQADVVRAAILIRINMLLKGFSGVKLADLECYRVLLNGGITPVVAQYGGLAAEIAVSRNDRPKYRSDPPKSE